MISLDAYQSTIGLFNLEQYLGFNKFCLNTCPRKNTIDCRNHFFIFSTLLKCYASLKLFLIQFGDMEINPGPIQKVIRGYFHQEE